MIRHACWLAALMAAAVTAEAQLAAPVRSCVDDYNNLLRMVSQQAVKSARACLRAAAGGGEGDPDGCVVDNRDGRLAGKQARVAALYGNTCDGSEPIQQGAAIGNAAHRGAITDLVHDLFDQPVTRAVVGLGADDTRCLDVALKRSAQTFAAIVTAHRQCAKRGLENGSVVDGATLDATCGTFAQLENDGKPQYRLDQLSTDLGAACAASTARLATLFPGLAAACHASGTTLGGCVGERIRCRACLALNDADGQHIDCDLFDDGTANQSCRAASIGTHTCTFAPSSRMLIINSALPISIQPTGAMTLSCGSPGADQTAACRCDLIAMGASGSQAIVLPAIGDVCVTPAPGCDPGRIDCDGGMPADVDLAADHNIGGCASNAGCAAACDARCADAGPTSVRRVSSCEGYCDGGANAEMPCTRDSDCPGGGCVGGDPVTHPGVCNCACEGTGLGAPGGAGTLACALGLQLQVERPSDGHCGGPAVATLAPLCVGLTTERATAVDQHADNQPTFTLSFSSGPAQGAASSCGAIAAGDLAGLTLVGDLVTFDTTLGDNLAQLSLVCQ